VGGPVPHDPHARRGRHHDEETHHVDQNLSVFAGVSDYMRHGDGLVVHIHRAAFQQLDLVTVQLHRHRLSTRHPHTPAGHVLNSDAPGVVGCLSERVLALALELVELTVEGLVVRVSVRDTLAWTFLIRTLPTVARTHALVALVLDDLTRSVLVRHVLADDILVTFAAFLGALPLAVQTGAVVAALSPHLTRRVLHAVVIPARTGVHVDTGSVELLVEDHAVRAVTTLHTLRAALDFTVHVCTCAHTGAPTSLELLALFTRHRAQVLCSPLQVNVLERALARVRAQRFAHAHFRVVSRAVTHALYTPVVVVLWVDRTVTVLERGACLQDVAVLLCEHLVVVLAVARLLVAREQLGPVLLALVQWVLPRDSERVQVTFRDLAVLREVVVRGLVVERAAQTAQFVFERGGSDDDD
jgi:hypothetical protein